MVLVTRSEKEIKHQIAIPPFIEKEFQFLTNELIDEKDSFKARVSLDAVI